MWEFLIPIADQLVSLVKHRKGKKQAVFHNHIEPLFQEMSAVHSNYVHGFLSLKSEIPEGDFAGYRLIGAAKEMSSHLKPVRTKIKSIARGHWRAMGIGVEGINSNNLEKWMRRYPVEYFIIECLNYFGVELGYGLIYGSPWWVLEDSIEKTQRKKFASRLDYQQAIDGLLKTVERRWEDVTRAYANARRQLLPL